MNTAPKKATDANTAEEADMEAAIMAQLELTLAGGSAPSEEVATPEIGWYWRR